MWNQAFSSENFRQIFDYENRRGTYLEAEFFPKIEKLTQAIKVCMGDIRNLTRLKGQLLPQYYELREAMLNDEKLKLKKEKEDLLTKELEKISEEISSGNASIGLRVVTTPAGQRTCSVQKTAAAYFASKQLQYNVRKLYKVKQSNRHEIICQLKSILADSFPKYIIRTDIANFYESIPSSKVLKKIDEDLLLTLPSRRMIRNIIHAYHNLTGTTTGVPMGIGISAYLAELYVRSFDEAVKAHEY